MKPTDHSILELPGGRRLIGSTMAMRVERTAPPKTQTALERVRRSAAEEIRAISAELQDYEVAALTDMLMAEAFLESIGGKYDHLEGDQARIQIVADLDLIRYAIASYTSADQGDLKRHADTLSNGLASMVEAIAQFARVR